MSSRGLGAVAVLAVFLANAAGQQTGTNPFEGEIRQMLAREVAHPPAKGGILFVGSSSIRLWKSLASDFPGYSVINHGFGGSQLSDSVYYAKRIVTPFAPKMVVLFAGTNDIAAGKSAETVASDFQAFVNVVRSEMPKVRIAYISITPAPSRWEKQPVVQRANSLIRQACFEGENLVYIDLVPLMLTETGGPRPELFIGDRLHPNAAGYTIWRKTIAPYLPWGTDKE